MPQDLELLREGASPWRHEPWPHEPRGERRPGAYPGAMASPDGPPSGHAARVRLLVMTLLAATLALPTLAAMTARATAHAPGTAGAAAAGGATDVYLVRVTVSGRPAAWEPLPPARRHGDELRVPAGSERALLRFSGGALDLALPDLGRWLLAHVLEARAVPRGDAFRVDATVRHADEGWEHYADAWRLVPRDPDGTGDAAAVGVRELAHPHVDEQPFTRSLAGVAAVGGVWLEARDSRHGWGGSRVGLDLEAGMLASGRGVEVSWHAERLR